MKSTLYVVLGSRHLKNNFLEIKEKNDLFSIESQPEKYYYHIAKTKNFENTKKLIKKKLFPAIEGRFYWIIHFINFTSEIALEDFLKYFKNKMIKINDYYKKVHRKNFEINIYDDDLYKNKSKIDYEYIYSRNRKNNLPTSEIRDFLISSCHGWKNLHKKNFSFDVIDLTGFSDNSEVFDIYDDKKRNIENRRKINECQYIYILGPDLPDKIDNFKIGIAKDVDKRLYDYKTHSPGPVSMHYVQSCLGETAIWVERDLKSILSMQNLYQEWFRMNLYDLKNVVKGVLRYYGQPEYLVHKDKPDSSVYWDRKNFTIFYNREYYYFRFNNHTRDKTKEKITLLHIKKLYPIPIYDDDKESNENIIKEVSNDKNLLETLEFFYQKICRVKNVKGHKNRINYGNAYF